MHKGFNKTAIHWNKPETRINFFFLNISYFLAKRKKKPNQYLFFIFLVIAKSR